MGIHTFDPVIYPRLLWVQIGTESPVEFSDVSEFSKNSNAQVDFCHDDLNNKGGVLIRFSSTDATTPAIITHEAIHAAIGIMQYCDIKLDENNQEVLCYLAGWVAKCCDEVAQEAIESDKKNYEKLLLEQRKRNS